MGPNGGGGIVWRMYVSARVYVFPVTPEERKLVAKFSMVCQTELRFRRTCFENMLLVV